MVVHNSTRRILCGGLLSTLYRMNLKYIIVSILSFGYVHFFFLLSSRCGFDCTHFIIYNYRIDASTCVHVFMVNCVDEEGNLSGAVMTLLCLLLSSELIIISRSEELYAMIVTYTHGKTLFMDFNRFFFVCKVL